MDFHKLTRRELQALCKKNKIPANITNVAMADSLKALEIVEGIEEFLQPCQSETAESSIESPARSEVTSPLVPPTGGRSTRRRNVAKKETETVKPLTRTQRTNRKTLVKYADESQADEIETPAVVAQTNRKKGSTTSACPKMDSQLKECVEEEKKDVLMTPVPSAVTSRRRRAVKEESVVTRVYSTRRSVRLAEKNLEVLNEVGNENSGLLKKDLFTNDGRNLEMNLKEGSDDSDQISGITGVDEKATLEENSEKKEAAEEVSSQKLDMSTVIEAELGGTIVEEIGNNLEADGYKPEVKESNDVEIEEVGCCFEIEAELDKQKSDKTEDHTGEIVIMSTVNISEPVSTIEEEMSNHFEADGYKPEVKESNDVGIEELGFGFEIESAELNKQKCDKLKDPEDENVIVPTFNEKEIVSTFEEELSNHFEADGYKLEVKENNDAEIEEVGFGFEIETEQDKPKCDKADGCEDENVILPQNVSERAQENGSDDVYTSEIEIAVENTEELNADKDVGYDDKAADRVEDVVLESKDNSAVVEVSCDTNIHNEIEKEMYNDKGMDSEDVTDFNVTEKVQEINADMHVDLGEKELNPDESSNSVILEAKEESTNDSLTDMSFDISLMNEEEEAKIKLNVSKCIEGKNETELKLQQATREVLPEAKLDDVAIEEFEEIAIVQHEEDKKAIDLFPSDAPSFAGLDSSHIVQTTCLTPIKNSAGKPSVIKKRMTFVSDNKENIGSGSKVVLTKERVQIAENTAENVPKLDALSVRQLTKMLKEKLAITNKSMKNENDNEASARPALQPLRENC